MKWRNEVLPVTASGKLVSAAKEERPSPSEEGTLLQPDPEVKQPTQQQVTFLDVLELGELGRMHQQLTACVAMLRQLGSSKCHQERVPWMERVYIDHFKRQEAPKELDLEMPLLHRT